MPFHLQGHGSRGQSNTFCAILHAGHGVGEVVTRILLPEERENWDEEG